MKDKAVQDWLNSYKNPDFQARVDRTSRNELRDKYSEETEEGTVDLPDSNLRSPLQLRQCYRGRFESQQYDSKVEDPNNRMVKLRDLVGRDVFVLASLSDLLDLELTLEILEEDSEMSSTITKEDLISNLRKKYRG